MTIKTIDERGRLTLGREFAGCTVIIDDSDPRQIVVKPMKLVPAHEAWLYENQAARGLVRRGLAESRAGIVSEKAPDIAADSAWADMLED